MRTTPKKILIVSSSFYPKNSPRSFRTTELVKEFCRMGHNVTLMTTYKSKYHDEMIKNYGFSIKDLGQPKLGNIPISEKGIFRLISRISRRSLGLLFEYPAIEWMFKVKNKLQKESGYDLLISIAMPHSIHWGTAWARKTNNKLVKVWVADCGDPFMMNHLDSFKKPFYFMFFEKWFCRKSDFISIPKIDMKVNFYKEFSEKILEIPQGFNFSDSLQCLKSYNKNNIPTFAYSGSFIQGHRDPTELLNFLTTSDIDYIFHIFTTNKYLVPPFIEKAKGRIILHDYLPRTELLGFLSEMDFLINISFDPKSQIPSKLIDYLLTGRPILNIDSVFDKENVTKFLQGDYSGKFIGLDLERYRIETVCRKFLQLSEYDHKVTISDFLNSYYDITETPSNI